MIVSLVTIGSFSSSDGFTDRLLSSVVAGTGVAAVDATDPNPGAGALTGAPAVATVGVLLLIGSSVG